MYRLLAQQFRKPTGWIGKIVAKGMNRGNAPMSDSAIAALDVQATDHVMEIGFGGGAALKRLLQLTPKGQVVGVDFSDTMVEQARQRFHTDMRQDRLALHLADAANLPLADASIDKAMTANTLYFWPEPLQVLSEVRRVLKPGGRFALAFRPKAAIEKIPVTHQIFRLYDPDEVERLFQAAGFTDVKLVYFKVSLGHVLVTAST